MKKAFTLIELLVTIVIIGLILALLFPAMGAVREGARRVQCMNNLRQHGIAWYLYLDEHDDCFPVEGQEGAYTTTFGGRGRGGSDKTENRVLNRYLDIYSDNDKGALELFHCPDDAKPWIAGKTTFDYFGNSYLFNRFILKFDTPERPRPLSAITSPRNKVFLENCYEDNTPGHGGNGNVNFPETPVMVLFVDGHVAGPFLWNKDLEFFNPVTDKPVIVDTNGNGILGD